MLRTNEEDLVKISVTGEISHPVEGQRPYIISHDGQVMVLPGVGGITYNKRVGDKCVGLAGDHVEPGVSTKNTEKADFYAPAYNRAYNALACIGNEATVVKSDGAKGEKGIVTGKHGGIEHVIVDFSPETLEKLVVGDKVQVKAFGQGLKLLDHPKIAVRSLDPAILHKMPIEEKGGLVRVGVAKMVPAKIMGSGLGADQTWTGDYDIQLFDEKTVEEYDLGDLRFGDFVAIVDADHTYGRIYRQGAISVGIVVHSACFISGHGPGVTTLLTTGEAEVMEVYSDENANLAGILGIL
jgi:hypothetical protein